MKLDRWATALFAAAALFSATEQARADIVTTFMTPSGSTTSGPVSAEADITTGAGTVTLTLTNLTANPRDVAQNLSALTIAFSNPVGANSLTSSSSTERRVTGPGFSDGTTVATGWLESSTTSSLKVDDLGGGAGPKHTIIGAPGPGGYTNANPSITGGSHNPLLNQVATFVFCAEGVTANTQVTGVTFQFGTTDGVGTVTSHVASVPEPSSVALATVGLLACGIGGCLRRRSQRKADETASNRAKVPLRLTHYNGCVSLC